MAPRTLEPVPVSQLAIWGLRGLTALDPDLTAELREGKLRARDAGTTSLRRWRRPPTATSTAGPPRPRTSPWPRQAPPCRCAALEPKASCRASSTNCSTTLIRTPATWRRVTPSEDRERRVGRAGAGLRLARRGAAIAVVEAIADGPGALAGIRPGDTIVSVDGQSTRGKDPATVMSWIAGPEETQLIGCLAWPRRASALGQAGTRRGAAGDRLRTALRRSAA